MESSHSSALLYDAHHQRHLEDLPFWIKLAQQTEGPILELGCGTGRILLPLLDRGLQVIGLDRDAQMLAQLQQNSSARSVPPSVIQADMTQFHFSGSFQLILLPCNTLSTLDERQRANLFNLVEYHLSPGGVFAGSIANPRLLASLPTEADPEIEETFSHPLDGYPVEVWNSWTRDRTTFRLCWHYDHLDANGSRSRISSTVTHFLIPAAQYISEIEAAGLKIIHQYGNYHRRSYAPRSQNLILVAQKPETQPRF